MTWISKTITVFGALLLAHACYSAQEHSALQSFRAATATTLTSSPPSAATSLPIDIVIETISATLIVALGLVLGTPPLRPIQWRVWAGKVEREGEEGFLDHNGEVNKDYVGNPFRMLETRPGFVDIRKQRKEFADDASSVSSTPTPSGSHSLASSGYPLSSGSQTQAAPQTLPASPIASGTSYQTPSTTPDPQRDDAQANTHDVDETSDRDSHDALNEVIMAINMDREGSVGCAHYIASDEALYLQEDVKMGGVEIVNTMLIRIQPTTILISNKASDALGDVLEREAQRVDDHSSDGQLQGGYILRHLISTEFNYEAAMERLIGLDDLDAFKPGGVEVVSREEGGSDSVGVYHHTRRLRLAGIINVNNPLAIGCAGAVLNDLDRRRAAEHLPFQPEAPPGFCVKSLQMTAFTNFMLVSADTLISLQILPSGLGLKRKREQSKHENLSVLRLVQELACTPQGKARLARMFLQPSLSLDLIAERQKSVAVFLREENREVASAIRKHLRKTKDIRSTVLDLKKGIAGCQTSKQLEVWKRLSRFAIFCTKAKDAVGTLSGSGERDIFLRIDEEIDTRKLLEVDRRIHETIDIQLSKDSGQMEIMQGVSPKLDELKYHLASIDYSLQEARERIVAQIPLSAAQHVMACTFLLGKGFLVAVRRDPNTGEGLCAGAGTIDDRWEEVISSGDVVYYKNGLMRQYDDEFGDIEEDIIVEEAQIIADLTTEVLQYESLLVAVSKLIGELDSLFALARAARKYQWTAPDMTMSNIINIQQGRHPLQEMVVPSFIPNDCIMAGGPGSDNLGAEAEADMDAPSMMILTGPNHSGKTVYLKQVAIIVYLAHIGSYVPAMHATIGLTDRILTRLATRESITVADSAFIVDLKQAVFALNFATRRSLLLVDEFGKGTDAIGGAAILGGYLSYILGLGLERPKVLASTHFHEIFDHGFLQPGDGLAFAHMNVYVEFEATQAHDQLTYLYRLQPGRSTSSFGTKCAAILGLDEDIVERAEAIALMLDRNEDLVEWASAPMTEHGQQRLERAELIARRFLAWDIPKPGETSDSGGLVGMSKGCCCRCLLDLSLNSCSFGT
ncbi:muts domain V-domain-containing protein [Diplogelasinospora grovesii]|uniref:DNA mismatch repair protein MSH5 n=1 Tax=Diplogelasinospora grovesii TaxID=303347 RepID=A0AAN6S5G5_9PEZI|nr:muts domain V-domain-containing protein [Diplogelasinospora grovesii]